jgi:ATP-dependent protease ClpP protease subunit
MVCRVDGNTITLTGVVGENLWDDGFTSGDVITALAIIGSGNPVTVVLNSGGGYATEGAAIYSALKGHGAPVEVIVQGVAASAASLIAMAGATVIMSLGSVMMIHDPSTVTWGTAADHQRSVDMLNALATSYAGIYAAKSGGTIDEMRAFMRDELWMTPEEAVAKGFADQVESASNDNAPIQASAFAYGVYAKAPEPLRALASAKGWKPRGPTMTAPPVQPPQPKAEAPPKEPKMSEVTEAVKADRARSQGIMSHVEAKGREALAQKLAYETDLSVEAAVDMLKVAPKASADDNGGESFEERKTRMQDTDGLGLPGKKPTAKGDGQKAWAKALERVNGRAAS